MFESLKNLFSHQDCKHKALKIVLMIILVGAIAFLPINTVKPIIADNLRSVQPDIRYTLRTDVGEGKLVFEGVGGEIDKQVNPDLKVNAGDIVQIVLIDGDGTEHDITIPAFEAQSDRIIGKGSSAVLVFEAKEEGVFDYICSIPGHMQAGMMGNLIVEGETTTQGEVNKEPIMEVGRAPDDLPSPLVDRASETVRLDLETTEERGQLGDYTTYNYWTFNNKVPGPLLRVKVGDTVEVHLKNREDSRSTHSVDFHAVTGSGGGSVMTQAAPGEEKVFSFKALHPGLYVYHCATPMVAHHITNGMYGMILVEPEEGLPAVDREFYVMQGEIYTVQRHGHHGDLDFSVDKLLQETPEYVVFNGTEDTLKKNHPLQAKVGETIRIFFGVGGPNLTSSFHVIGEIMDRVYEQASLTSPPLTNVQTTTVAPGGATMVEITLDVPGKYLLVDHALSRLEKGLVGVLQVEGDEQPELYSEGPTTTTQISQR